MSSSSSPNGKNKFEPKSTCVYKIWPPDNVTSKTNMAGSQQLNNSAICKNNFYLPWDPQVSLQLLMPRLSLLCPRYPSYLPSTQEGATSKHSKYDNTNEYCRRADDPKVVGSRPTQVYAVYPWKRYLTSISSVHPAVFKMGTQL